jgi:hypothetical protein
MSESIALPDEIIVYLLSYLENNDLYLCNVINKQFYQCSKQLLLQRGISLRIDKIEPSNYFKNTKYAIFNVLFYFSRMIKDNYNTNFSFFNKLTSNKKVLNIIIRRFCTLWYKNQPDQLFFKIIYKIFYKCENYKQINKRIQDIIQIANGKTDEYNYIDKEAIKQVLLNYFHYDNCHYEMDFDHYVKTFSPDYCNQQLFQGIIQDSYFEIFSFSEIIKNKYIHIGGVFYNKHPRDYQRLFKEFDNKEHDDIVRIYTKHKPSNGNQVKSFDILNFYGSTFVFEIRYHEVYYDDNSPYTIHEITIEDNGIYEL